MNKNVETIVKNMFIHEGQIPNPSLNKFNRLIGEWKTTGTHPYVPFR